MIKSGFRVSRKLKEIWKRTSRSWRWMYLNQKVTSDSPLIIHRTVHIQKKKTTMYLHLHQHRAALHLNLTTQSFLILRRDQPVQNRRPLTIHQSRITWPIQNHRRPNSDRRALRSKGRIRSRGNRAVGELPWKQEMSPGRCGCEGRLRMWELLLKPTSIHGRSSLIGPLLRSSIVSVDLRVRCLRTRIPIIPDLLLHMMWMVSYHSLMTNLIILITQSFKKEMINYTLLLVCTKINLFLCSLMCVISYAEVKSWKW